MEIEHLCLGCMNDKGTNRRCPVCGYEDGDPPKASHHLPVGTVLNDRYLVGRSIGEGGFGITYVAWDRALDIKLAIKEYFPVSLATRIPGQTVVSVVGEERRETYEYGLSRFLDEARILAQFDQTPGIVSARDFFEANGTAYMVMNYLEGMTLKQYLLKKGPLSFETAVAVLMPVMDALREVHRRGLVHRDVSPDNIFITDKGQVRLLDFGAARYALSNQNKGLSVVLKPGYAPEEQCRSNGKQGPWTDVYATAATLYRCITGQIPPDSLDRLDKDTLVPPSQLGVLVAPDQEAALLKALSVRAENRFQTIEEFQAALSRNKKGPGSQPQKRDSQGVRPQRPATPSPAPIKEKRTSSPKTATLLILALLLVALGGAFAYVTLGHRESPEQLYREAETLYSQGRYQEALGAYQKAFDEKPGFAECAVGIGRCNLALGQYDQALEAFKKALSLSPGLPEALEGLKEARQGAQQAALAGAASGESDPAVQKFLEGEGLLAQGSYQRAADAFNTSTQLDPENADAWQGLGRAYSGLNEYADAIRAFRRASELKPGDVHILLDLGAAYAAAKRTSDAITTYEQVLNLDPNSTEAKQALEQLNAQVPASGESAPEGGPSEESSRDSAPSEGTSASSDAGASTPSN